ncbi:histidine phosphatase family protein [Sulfitobacter sp. LCG007]
MSHITLIRHGQANSAARDELDYDRLSALGHRQSAWLGSYLRDCQHFHARLYTGTLRRHVETAEAMGIDLEPVRDARLNELEYFTLARAMETEHGLPVPDDREGFVAHLPRIFTAWQEDRIAGAPESFADFETRIRSVLTEIAEGDGPALVVTSGGLIAFSMRHAMRLDIGATATMALAIFNSSLHRLFPIGGSLAPVLFNAIPHLEPPDRHHAQTHL